MKSEFSIKCRFTPVGRFGPLLPSVDSENHFLLIVPQLGQSPQGFDADGLIFDMQNDGGVDTMEIPRSLIPGLVDREVACDPDAEYLRLFIELDDKKAVEQHAQLQVQRTGTLLTLRIAPGRPEKKCLIGPGVNALVGDGELQGISVDLAGLMR